MKLTTGVIDTLTLPVGATDKIYFDETLPGFGLRMRASGARAWVVLYDIAGKTRRFTLGSPQIFTLAQARTEAKKILAAVRLGRDPAGEKRAVRQKQDFERRSAPHWDLEHRVAQKALAFLERGQEPGGYLYRHYHPSGDLLYVGVSLEPLRRQDRHLKVATWRVMICRIVIEPFETREAALAAEQRAIRNEFPNSILLITASGIQSRRSSGAPRWRMRDATDRSNNPNLVLAAGCDRQGIFRRRFAWLWPASTRQRGTPMDRPIRRHWRPVQACNLGPITVIDLSAARAKATARARGRPAR